MRGFPPCLHRALFLIATPVPLEPVGSEGSHGDDLDVRGPLAGVPLAVDDVVAHELEPPRRIAGVSGLGGRELLRGGGQGQHERNPNGPHGDLLS